jgi:hypothetical protein
MIPLPPSGWKEPKRNIWVYGWAPSGAPSVMMPPPDPWVLNVDGSVHGKCRSFSTRCETGYRLPRYHHHPWHGGRASQARPLADISEITTSVIALVCTASPRFFTQRPKQMGVMIDPFGIRDGSSAQRLRRALRQAV